MPVAVSVPITEPAEVPTMTSASAARQPVSDSSASNAPMSHEAPTTPPAPRTRPTRMSSATSKIVRGDSRPTASLKAETRIANYADPTHLPNRESAFRDLARRSSGRDSHVLMAAIGAGPALDVQCATALDAAPPPHHCARHRAVPDGSAALASHAALTECGRRVVPSFESTTLWTHPVPAGLPRSRF